MMSISLYNPGIGLTTKLCSLAVHIDEALGSGGHQFDWESIKAIINDREVQSFLSEMDKAALLPLRRDGVRYKPMAATKRKGR